MHSHRVLLASASILLGIGVMLPINVTTHAQNPQNDNYGFIRFFHAAIDVPPLDIYISDSDTPTVRNLAYGEATDFMTLPSSTQGFVARAAGSGSGGDILFRLNRRVKANQSEIITAAGLNSRRAFVLEPLVLVRSETRGKARVRVFNTVWGGPYLTVKDNRGATYGQDLQYLSSSADSDVDPGVYSFEIQSGGGKPVATEENAKLEADKVYSLMIIGGMDGTPPVRFVVLVSDQETTRVRIVNDSNAPADIYIKGNDTPFVRALPPASSTDYVPVPSGATTFVLRAAGSAPNSSELAFVAPQLRPGRDVTITINGSGVATQMGLTDDHLTLQPGPSTSTPKAEAETPTAVQEATQAR